MQCPQLKEKLLGVAIFSEKENYPLFIANTQEEYGGNKNAYELFQNYFKKAEWSDK
jgi:hypothetical protein